MVDRTLAEFVKDALGRGSSRADIENALGQAGWHADQIRAALAGYADVAFPTPVPLPKPYVSAREAFLYLVLFILLGVLAIHLGVLLFTLIDVFMPRDAQPSLYQIGAASGAIRWAVAALAVALPVYLVLSWRLQRARRRNPSMQGSRIRKWLTYITLVFAASTLIGDFIAVIYGLLSGELTLRFLMKAGVIAAIAGVIFFYYVRDAERDEDAPPPVTLDRIVGGGVTAVAVAASIAGVSVIDSPADVRAYERDETRLTAIADTAGAIDCYYSYENATPESLAAMRTAMDERSSRTPIEYSCTWHEQVDPATGAPYEYSRIDTETYELCAVFDRPTRETGQQQTRTYSWRQSGGWRTLNATHPAGRHCFTLTAESLADAEDAR